MKPFDVIDSHLKWVKDFYIILVPFREEHLIEEHLCSFTSTDSFPDTFDNFQKVFSEVKNLENNPYRHLMVIYQRTRSEDKEKMTFS